MGPVTKRIGRTYGANIKLRTTIENDTQQQCHQLIHSDTIHITARVSYS